MYNYWYTRTMTEEEKLNIVVIVGPTGSGKTALSLMIAGKYNGEVISADSRQVYRGLDIGTEKITEEEKLGIPHHLISIIPLEQVYTAVDFKHDAERAIAEMASRGKLPVIAGGTFFYIDTLLGRVSTPPVAIDASMRAILEEWSTEELFAELLKRDPRRALTIDKNNPRRLIRALEITETMGTVPETILKECPYNVLMLGIKTKPTELRERLQARAERAIDRGLIEETKQLLAQGASAERLREIGLEYRLVLDYLDGTMTKQELIQKCTEKNWQYAKRQRMWLKRDTSIVWVNINDTESILKIVQNFLN